MMLFLVSPKAYEVDYDHGSHDEYAYKDGPAHPNGHLGHARDPHAWDQDHHFARENQACTNTDSDKYAETGDFSAEFEARLYPESTTSNVDHNAGYRNQQCHGDHSTRNHFQVSDRVNRNPEVYFN